MAIPDWQLPSGVDRGLWDYMHAADMVAGYDAQVAAAPVAAADVRFCDEQFPTPGRLIDLGCGTGRLGRHFAAKGFECVGVDLSDEMLARAESPGTAVPGLSFRRANLINLEGVPDESFDYAACLFSTLGMVRGDDHRRAALASARRVLRPGGRLVLHAHNRHFYRLRPFGVAERRMPQAYGGAPLALRHFSRGELRGLLTAAGFRVAAVRAVGTNADGRLPHEWWLPAVRAHGFLAAAVHD